MEEGRWKREEGRRGRRVEEGGGWKREEGRGGRRVEEGGGSEMEERERKDVMMAVVALI